MAGAKILRFGKRTGPRPPCKEARDSMANQLFQLAVEAEAGDFQEMAVAIVFDDGEFSSAYVTPYDPRRMLRSIEALKRRVLEKLEEEGPRETK